MVARETSVRLWLEYLGVSPTPPGAVERLVALSDLLSDEGVSRGIIGPNERTRVLERHVVESCALLPFVGDGGLLVDVGSGGGLPGLPLACIRTGPVVMIESQARRVAFVRHAIAQLDVPGAEVLHARAEDAAYGGLREAARAVVARALAPPAVALELCLPFAEVGGVVVIPVGSPARLDHGPGSEPACAGPPASGAVDPPNAATPAHGPSEVASLSRVAAELGGGEPGWESLGRPEPDPSIGIPDTDESRLVLVVPKVEPTADRYPRRAGVPSRRPLG